MYQRSTMSPWQAVSLLLFFVSFFISNTTVLASPTAVFDTAITITESGKNLNTVGDDYCSADPTPGCDFSDTDNVVRTNDGVIYTFSYSLNDGSDNVVLDSTLPLGMVWDVLPGFCNPATSSITGDGVSTPSVLVCDRGTQTGSEDLPFPAKVLGDNPNGTMHDVSFNVIGDTTPSATSDPVQIEVTAAPRWNVRKELRASTLQTDGSGNPTGYLLSFYYYVELWRQGDVDPRVGNELLDDPITFTDDLGQVSPNATLVSCNDNARVNNTYDPSEPEQSVIDGGTTLCSQTSAGGDIAITITGADTSLNHYPTEYTNGNAIPADRFIASGGRVNVFVPIEDVNDAGGNLEVLNEYTDFDPDSISGQSNWGSDDEDTGDNTAVVTIGITGAAGWQTNKLYVANTNGAVVGTATGHRDGNGLIAPNEIFYARLHVRNNGEVPLTGITICDVIDSDTYELVAYSGTNQAVDVGAGNEYSGSYAVEYGVGYVNGSWPPTSLPDGDATAAECADDASTWYSSLDDVPGGQTATKVRIHINEPLPSTGDNTARFYLRLQALENPDGTILPNFSTFKNQQIDSGDWKNCAYNPGTYPAGTHNGNNCGDRVMIARAVARITKETNFNNNVNSVTVGGTVGYVLKPTYTSSAGSPEDGNVTIVDTLPEGLTYKSGTAVVGGVATEPQISMNGNQQVLTWNLGNRTPNDPLPIIEFTADVALDLGTGDELINTVVISGEGDPSPEEDRTATRSVVVAIPEGLIIGKVVNTPWIFTNEQTSFTVNYRNNSQSGPFTQVDLIDVLPWNGDGRTPNTDYTGTQTFNNVTPESNDFELYYTKATPGSIHWNPQDSSNDLSTGSTVWCSSFSGGSCPDDAGEVTAFRIIDNEEMPVGDTRSFTLIMDTNGNTGGDIYTNNASAAAAEVVLSVRSNDVTVIVPEFDWGDLPDDQYPTDRSQNGPVHFIRNTGPRLGNNVDSEDDGQPSPGANADTNEDGVTRQNADNAAAIGWRNGDAEDGDGGKITVEITEATGILQLWIDFGSGLEPVTLRDEDGNIIPAGELDPGTHIITFDIPDGTFDGSNSTSLAARFRLSTAGGLDTTGVANDGEVEDYIWPFGPNPIQLQSIGGAVTSSNLWLFGIVILLLLIGTILTVNRQFKRA
ncbi:MAG: GEVED domain-containing protein [Chloroflexota bacterium]